MLVRAVVKSRVITDESAGVPSELVIVLIKSPQYRLLTDETNYVIVTVSSGLYIEYV
jgi:hypothetical protein